MTEQELADLLAASIGSISNWTKDLQQEQRDEEKARIIDLWLACRTHDEISNIVGKDRSVVTKIVQNFRDENLHNLTQTPPESLRTFNLWRFEKASGMKYPGQIPGQIIENLLWYFTKPFDVVYDPMAGSC